MPLRSSRAPATPIPREVGLGRSLWTMSFDWVCFSSTAHVTQYVNSSLCQASQNYLVQDQTPCWNKILKQHWDVSASQFVKTTSRCCYFCCCFNSRFAADQRNGHEISCVHTTCWVKRYAVRRLRLLASCSASLVSGSISWNASRLTSWTQNAILSELEIFLQCNLMVQKKHALKIERWIFEREWWTGVYNIPPGLRQLEN